MEPMGYFHLFFFKGFLWSHDLQLVLSLHGLNINFLKLFQ